MVARRLLVSDLDGTLLGDAAALARFARWLDQMRDSTVVAYASGRRFDSVRAAVDDEGLPEPDVVISSVGTEIHDGAGRPWPHWLEGLDQGHGDRARTALRGEPGLTLQAAEHQTPLKASFDAPGLGAAGLTRVRATLEAAAIGAVVMYSDDRFLDVLPRAAGKGPATRFVAAALGIDDEDVLTFGDSGNDLDMLGAGFRGTIVANARPELLAEAPRGVYRSPRAFADGVLDGIRHWAEQAAVTPTSR
jgi:sucrose-6F-phosphate phosphohydrolase